MPALPALLTIGELARRSGTAPSALRFYESRGLIRSSRTKGDQRRYERAMLRRVAFVRAAQRMGLSLQEVVAALSDLPADHTPTARDWERVSRSWRARLDARVEELERLRDDLSSCIGCGCLSLTTCKILNRDDAVAGRGPGARYLAGDPKPVAQPRRRRVGETV